MAEPALHYKWRNLQGHLRAGAWWNGNNTPELTKEGAPDGNGKNPYGFYLTWDQELWIGTKTGDVQSTLGAFAQYGRSPESLFEV